MFDDEYLGAAVPEKKLHLVGHVDYIMRMHPNQVRTLGYPYGHADPLMAVCMENILRGGWRLFIRGSGYLFRGFIVPPTATRVQWIHLLEILEVTPDLRGLFRADPPFEF